MSCKKNIWNNCESNKWDNVCYYKYKNGCSKNCNKDIAKTKCIIDDIRAKNNLLGKDLKDAKENQKVVKCALDNIDDNVANLVKDIGNIEDALINAVKSLNCIIKDLDKAIPAQNAALEDIRDAQNKQKDLKDLIDNLEYAFDNTVECLKEKDGNPILIPWDDCNEEKPDWGCGC